MLRSVFPINPSTVARYRKAFTQSGAKNDPSDALIQTEIIERHMDKLSYIEPESPEIRALGMLVEGRRSIVQNRVDLANKITAILKLYYPQVLDWFEEKDSAIFCDFVVKSNASEMQKYAGIAPVIEQSGQKSWTHWRYSCPKFLRQTFVEWAGQSVRFSFWAKAYYDQQIAKGKPHNTVIRSLAFKWIRIVYRCWKTKTPYDESKYLKPLKTKKSPLLKYAIDG